MENPSGQNKQVRKQVKKVAFQMIAAFPVFDLPLTLSVNPMTKQFILMGIPTCNCAHLNFDSDTLISYCNGCFYI